MPDRIYYKKFTLKELLEKFAIAVTTNSSQKPEIEAAILEKYAPEEEIKKAAS